ncbi:putative BTB/POZ domain-containing protein-like [Capsicum annuum]|nr:putative BTB/POZ domain-containing protein-like [Capsicum annuum]
MVTPKDRVELNVGGRIFETTAATLGIAGEKSFFRAMFDENWNLHSDSAITEHFIDRDPDYFAVLLSLLRTGELYIPPKIDKRLLYREAEYYGILDQVRSAKWGSFDGNRVRLAESISDWSSEARSAKIVQASPSGGCCVAHGGVVRVYDWMLEEHPIIHTEHHNVNDVCWVDSESIVVSSDEKIASGGLGLFNASTGESKYKFQVTDELKGYKAGALSVSSNDKLFASCTDSTTRKHVIGVWDQVTGTLMNFFSCPPHPPHNAARLQWLHDINCVMVVSSSPGDEICLFDLRQNDMVWSWDVKPREKQYCCGIIDAIAIEKSSSICVLAEQKGMGFVDLRRTDASLNWRNDLMGTDWSYRDDLVHIDEYLYVKLAFHEGQLFSSRGNRIFVYGGSNWLPTSQFERSRGGPIRDYSIDGDRLFALQDNENIVDVWETPRPPII